MEFRITADIWELIAKEALADLHSVEEWELRLIFGIWDQGGQELLIHVVKFKNVKQEHHRTEKFPRFGMRQNQKWCNFPSIFLGSFLKEKTGSLK